MVCNVRGMNGFLLASRPAPGWFRLSWHRLPQAAVTPRASVAPGEAAISHERAAEWMWFPGFLVEGVGELCQPPAWRSTRYLARLAKRATSIPVPHCSDAHMRRLHPVPSRCLGATSCKLARRASSLG